jgi:cephalosporin hydroxylase
LSVSSVGGNNIQIDSRAGRKLALELRARYNRNTLEERLTAMITIDGDHVTQVDGDTRKEFNLGSPEAFAVLSQLWLRSGWGNKHVYTFTWLGRPMIQLPEDMIRLQEVIYRLQPDVIIETGVAHGGSLMFYASLCKLMERGRVIGVDLDIRSANRAAIEAHPIAGFIKLVEGDSIDPATVEKVTAEVRPGETVIVLLDSCHTQAHVRAELGAYSNLVSVGSYVVAMDGIMQELAGAPRTRPDWTWNNPQSAAREFVAANPDFRIEEPEFVFNESNISKRVTYWPGAFIKRLK